MHLKLILFTYNSRKTSESSIKINISNIYHTSILQKVKKILVVIHCTYNLQYNSDSRRVYYIDPRYKRIIGGEAVIIDQYPWVVGLFSSRYDEHPYCGASLISNRHLITAAHCIEGKLPNKVLIIPHPSNRKKYIFTIFRL